MMKIVIGVSLDVTFVERFDFLLKIAVLRFLFFDFVSTEFVKDLIAFPFYPKPFVMHSINRSICCLR